MDKNLLSNLPSDNGKESWGALAVAGFLCSILGGATGTQFILLLSAIVILTLAAGAGRIYMKRLQLNASQSKSDNLITDLEIDSLRPPPETE